MDNEGMVLIALISGADCIPADFPAGIPGCGIELHTRLQKLALVVT